MSDLAGRRGPVSARSFLTFDPIGLGPRIERHGIWLLHVSAGLAKKLSASQLWGSLVRQSADSRTALEESGVSARGNTLHMQENLHKFGADWTFRPKPLLWSSNLRISSGCPVDGIRQRPPRKAVPRPGRRNDHGLAPLEF